MTIQTQNGTQPDIRAALFCAQLKPSLEVGTTNRTAMLRGSQLLIFARYIAPSTAPMGNAPVSIGVVPPDGGRAHTFSGMTDADGYFYASVTIPRRWPTGVYQLTTNITFQQIRYTRTNGYFRVSDSRDPAKPGASLISVTGGWAGEDAAIYPFAGSIPDRFQISLFDRAGSAEIARITLRSPS